MIRTINLGEKKIRDAPKPRTFLSQKTLTAKLSYIITFETRN